MRPIRLLSALAGAVALAGTPVQARAQCVFPIEWGDAWAYETSYAGNVSNAGSVLTIVGKVNCFADLFAPYYPIPAGKEYTVYITDLVSDGTVVTLIDPPGPPLPIGNLYETRYTSGRVRIYEQDPGNAAFGTNPPNATVPSTFNDGTLFLDGTLAEFFVSFSLDLAGGYMGGNCDGHSSGSFTGGKFIQDNFPGGANCQMNVTGGWNVTPSALPAGYTADVAGKIDVDCPTQGETSTWGRVKSLYH